MYYAAGTHIKTNLYGSNRRLERTDGFFPTNTMLLHQRIIGWHRKKRIPVRDADTTSNLSAYLIDPKYLSNGEVVLPKELPEPQPQAYVPVYQYSRITRDDIAEEQKTFGPLSQTFKHTIQAVGLGASAFGAELSQRYCALTSPKPVTRYDVNRGVLPWWRQRVKMFAAALLGGSLIVAAATIDTSNTTKPTPVAAHPAPSSLQTAADNSSKGGLVSTNNGHNDPSNSNNNDRFTASSTNSSEATNNYQQQTPTNTTVSSPVVSSPLPTPSTPIATNPTVTTPTIDPVQTPDTSTTQPLDSILDPVTDTVNKVLSTQVSVNVPLGQDSSTDPIIEISQ